MAVRTDDPDSRLAFMYTDFGGNGDYYLHTIEIKDLYNEKGELQWQPVTTSMQLSTSGSQTPFEVRELIAQLHWKLEELKLNGFPDDAEIEKAIKEKNK